MTHSRAERERDSWSQARRIRVSAAILKKKVPILVTTNREKATLFLQETSKADKEGAG
jgi:hypothetical protein